MTAWNASNSTQVMLFVSIKIYHTKKKNEPSTPKSFNVCLSILLRSFSLAKSISSFVASPSNDHLTCLILKESCVIILVSPIFFFIFIIQRPKLEISCLFQWKNEIAIKFILWILEQWKFQKKTMARRSNRMAVYFV